MKKIILNPFYIYIITFSVTLFIYSLGWSNLFPKLSLELILFFIITFIISYFLGVIFQKIFYKKISFDVKYKYTNSIDFIYIITVLFIIVELIHNGGVPILMIIDQNTNYSYTEFGIKTFHSISFTLTSFYMIFLFKKYLDSKTIINFLKFISLYIYPLLIMSRGAFLIGTVAIMFIFIMHIKRISIKLFYGMGVLLILVLYTFGILGNIRESNDNFLISIASPSQAFLYSSVPSEFLWSYMYIASPLANLQANINNNANYNLDEFIIYNVAPDAIRKRMNEPPINIEKVAEWLTVGTMYSSAYKSFGWIGMFIVFLNMSIFIFIFIYLLSQFNIYFHAGYAIMLTMIVFDMFSNMLIFTGLSLQFIYPFILNIFQRTR